MHLGLTQTLCVASTLGLVCVCAQSLPSSFPHFYAGLPNTNNNFSDSAQWQSYFQVKQPLPNVTFALPRNYAGNLPVNRPGRPNNTLFFWGFENSAGSLTSTRNTKPWIIWLNGGPGSSSLLGLTLENGPIHFKEDFSAVKNIYSWDNAADVFWVDQPVGVGWSTSDADGYVTDENQVGQDFLGFLSNLVQVFPALKTRPLYLAGESYAGFYIPYILKTYFSVAQPPVTIKKISMADGSYGPDETDIYPGVPQVIQTYPQLIGFDPVVLEYFKEQSYLCGQDLNLTYPQNGPLPTVPAVFPGDGSATAGRRFAGRKALRATLQKLVTLSTRAVELSRRAGVKGLQTRRSSPAEAWKRSLDGRPNGSIDPFYGCDTFDEMADYAVNFSVPWVGNDFNGFDYIPDALEPEAAPNVNSVGVWLNDPGVISAVHAPTSKQWVSTFTASNGYPFGSGANFGELPTTFLSELAANSSAHGITWTFMSGNADSLLPHFGTEVVIQNMTFGGIQGFTQRPSTPWYDSQGNLAGKVHQERGITFVLFRRAGHLIPQTDPVASLTFLKEFLLKDNPLGLVTPSGATVGGTNATLAQSIMPAYRDPIYFGSATTQGSTVYPSATIAAWEAYVATAVPTQPMRGESQRASPPPQRHSG
ncbi:alpha/beta-hydrolase [Hysterangium stoloniferum]|nr:alpha/beta-hydrolase [Hysterangium stoloniferum]